MSPSHDDFRADLSHYWGRLIWYRDELWRITIPVWTVYGAFIISCVGFVWSADKTKITWAVAIMLMIVIATFSWIMLRMYWIYSHRIYTAIDGLNEEIRKREQNIYDQFLHTRWVSNYTRFRVYPELNVLFTIVGLAMMFASIFLIAASVGTRFELQVQEQCSICWVAIICLVLIVSFEKVLSSYAKRCSECNRIKSEGSS